MRIEWLQPSLRGLGLSPPQAHCSAARKVPNAYRVALVKSPRFRYKSAASALFCGEEEPSAYGMAHVKPPRFRSKSAAGALFCGKENSQCAQSGSCQISEAQV